MDFFVNSIASLREDMSHFKVNLLKLFLTCQLFNSGKRVDVYAGRGKAAAACGSWRLATNAPADALERLPRMLGGPFAVPIFALSTGSSVGGNSTGQINSSAPQAGQANSARPAATVGGGVGSCAWLR